MKAIRKAKLSDVPFIHRLVNGFAERGELLHRSLNELYENLRDYYVVEKDGEIIACCALHINWEDLAEIKSLVVSEKAQGQRLGASLLEACLDEARQLGVPKVFALTYKRGFFEKNGFQLVDKADLPQKIWTECVRCPKFPDCGEEALVLSLAGQQSKT
ncbi:MAG: N-acetyltransferase [Armatimonadota bacterium]|nr:N-acetyltransferase [Armatimonadota bacterium]